MLTFDFITYMSDHIVYENDQTFGGMIKPRTFLANKNPLFCLYRILSSHSGNKMMYNFTIWANNMGMFKINNFLS